MKHISKFLSNNKKLQVVWFLLSLQSINSKNDNEQLRGAQNLINLPDVQLPGDDYFDKDSFSLDSSPPQQYANNSASIPLQLCDCKYADSHSSLLNCANEGYFINRFEKYGIWLGMGPKVPLSRSLCCRPCLPKIPVKDNITKPLSIISMSCQPAQVEGDVSSPVLCDGSDDEFVVGFASQGQVRTKWNLFYPVGPAMCCKPVVLLSNGELWKVSQCDCGYAHGNVGCYGQSEGYLLKGFQSFKQHTLGYVPTEPASCCKPCLKQVPPTPFLPHGTCQDLNGCNGHGMCSFGMCRCDEGFVGSDCSMQAKHAPQMSVESRTWILASIIMAFAVLCALVKLSLQIVENGGCRCWRWRGQTSHGDGYSYIALDEEGSVGSQDSSIQRQQQHANNDNQNQQQQSILSSSTQQISGQESLGSRGWWLSWLVRLRGGFRSRSLQQLQSSQLFSESQEISQESVVNLVCTEEGKTEDIQGKKQELGSDIGEIEKGGEKGKESSIMMCRQCGERPVQVILVPCGHSTMCRRCSRSFHQCPECQTDIIRKQKLFLDVD